MPRWVPKPPIEHTRKGYQLHLDVEERDVLRGLLGQLRDLLLGPSDDPVLRRLFPAAYHLPGERRPHRNPPRRGGQAALDLGEPRRRRLR